MTRPHARGRRWITAGAVAALLAVGFGGCAAVPSGPRPYEVFAGDPAREGWAAVAAAPPADRPLWLARIGLTALRRGQWEAARSFIDDALLAQGAVAGPRPDAARARSLFGSEREKLFVGEPYERAMAFYYRAVLYWMAGEPDNARACYRSGQIIDSGAEQEAYRADWVLFDYLDALATGKLGGDGSDALARARASSRHPLPDPDPAANVLVFVEFGRGPTKFADGAAGERLRFQPGWSAAAQARLHVAGRSLELPPYDDLSFQATTRGGRVMDYLLGRQAVFRQSLDTAGDAALAGAVVAGTVREDNNDATVRGLAAAGVAGKVMAAAIDARADTRTWDNLPNYLSFGHLRLPPGEHAARLEFLDRAGRPVPELGREFALHVKPAPGDTVVFLSTRQL